MVSVMCSLSKERHYHSTLHGLSCLDPLTDRISTLENRDIFFGSTDKPVAMGMLHVSSLPRLP